MKKLSGVRAVPTWLRIVMRLLVYFGVCWLGGLILILMLPDALTWPVPLAALLAMALIWPIACPTLIFGCMMDQNPDSNLVAFGALFFVYAGAIASTYGFFATNSAWRWYLFLVLLLTQLVIGCLLSFLHSPPDDSYSP